MAKLNGKIALISGGTSGIGAETAKLFQSEGATVVVTGSSERSADAAKAALPGIEVLVSDAANVAATKALVDQVKTKHGRIDVLFVNAGIAKFAPIAQIDEAFYDSHFNINVKGAFFLIKHAIPVIPDGGAIILTASVAGANGGLGGSTVYGSTKAALRSFGRTIAKELTPRGIRVNTISPGPIVTPILDKGGFTAGSEGRLYRRRQDPHSAWPHRHRRRSCRRGPLPRRRCHLHHRRRTIRRRRPDRPIGPSVGHRSISERLDVRQSEASPHSAVWRRSQGSDEGTRQVTGDGNILASHRRRQGPKPRRSRSKRPILDNGGVTRQASPMFQGFQFPKTILSLV